MDEETKKVLQNVGVTEEELNDPAKVEELAKKLDQENKDLKQNKDSKQNEEENQEKTENPKKENILKDKINWLAKAIAENQALKDSKKDNSEDTTSKKEIENIIFARTERLSDEKVKVLQELSFLPANKSKTFEEISKTNLAKFSLQEITNRENAVDEIDENTDGEKIKNTNREILEQYNKTGKEPKTDYERSIVAAKQLKDLGFE